MNVIKQILVGFGKLILVFSILAAATIGFAIWKMYPINSYCDSLTTGMAFDNAVKMAHERALNTPFIDMDESDRLMVFNHDAPFFRLACEIHFKEGKLIFKKAIGAD
ncbi:hypothetical protein [Microbulbifer sp. PAAF003]|uniref:hypothetical protein n=1 Tax=Microbulbifer sp. PAAF003 TaxID=3243375 RepID=UPI0040395440